MNYKVGWPGWKIVARCGVPLLVRVQVHFDAESQSYWADSPDLDGLIVAGQDLNELHTEAVAAAGELLSLILHSPRAKAFTELRIRDDALPHTA
ncbi:MAG: hypothetical protein PHX60_14495 [Giesbergeria sp.]|uniref:hypothetical protein n=1 Tax=Giesbergeria sp. TaxID=2818473 RepID=UPI00260713F9|nr:hypothetical protein [Giesbergeria sp.]MDD2610866.1 hypothetical protein [Giesbergeria sp.]